jgi:folate-binding protein YgfZ
MAKIFDLSDRFKLRFSGPQALWFLDQLITNQVVELEPGSGRQALLLTPKGRITAVLRVLSTDGAALVDLEAADPAAVLEFFTMRIFATKVKIEDVTAQFALLRVLGDDAASQVASLAKEAVDLPREGNALVEFDSGYLVRLDEPLEGVDLWVQSNAKDYIFRTLVASGVHELSAGEYEAYRVIAGVPRFGVDFDSSYLPQEAALERAVHFKKGCYLGQEAVAMAQRGRIRRRVRHLELSGAPALGELWQGDVEAGSLTSAAGDGGRSFGIGTVKTVVAPEGEVQVRSGQAEVGTARVRVLPATVEGPSVPSARDLRERLQGGR